MIPGYPYYGKQTKCTEEPITFPPQHQSVQPGLEYEMVPRPIFENPSYIGSGKLQNKVAIVTGGDSGIGRAVAIAFAKEGADIAIPYLYEHRDANETKQRIEQLGRACLLIPGDLRSESICREAVDQTLRIFGKIDILILNQAVQFPQESVSDISAEQLHNTYSTNIYPMFYMTKAALPHLKPGSAIVSTASITAYRGAPTLIDYSSTKGAIVSFTRSLALSLVQRGIRVNAVAPGPIWTPLIVSSYSADEVSRFGLDTPMKRAGQPFELAPAFVFLAADDSSYVTGEVVHVNGGAMVTS
ncbi:MULTISPECIES: SDR family oxidoreductase [unclassified Paenibacillus]|uniref:SDR family oxidoreductase n=1 Tax=unclassified Paenibacillus TaxID=185978 RepID=UPI001AE52853|nr:MULTISPECIES: SDR family oxidoreductase [unclassified Paenibacillus]MBP1157047.1 NAD(P)-dependent dehydrogenase (short-subunit alcohol dehydrogenase family) [Paenibacillus sp. PvP091]MBP1172214.1 NAD(P)-dependent dehydrogenase (short-subunit alcohol dehydrogenase family) [Paenibacillus sp. PvR098]MBP2438595.1 NAD(P)-dependent dehydrogenase (short-subunit alcohol dehydrogenase family) [Paenibacillus sp. PvP052]